MRCKHSQQSTYATRITELGRRVVGFRFATIWYHWPDWSEAKLARNRGTHLSPPPGATIGVLSIGSPANWVRKLKLRWVQKCPEAPALRAVSPSRFYTRAGGKEVPMYPPQGTRAAACLKLSPSRFQSLLRRFCVTKITPQTKGPRSCLDTWDGSCDHETRSPISHNPQPFPAYSNQHSELSKLATRHSSRELFLLLTLIDDMF